MEKSKMPLKVCYSGLLAEYKRIIKKYYDMLENHQKEENYLEEYDRFYNRINCVSINQFQGDFSLLAYDFYCFLNKCEIKFLLIQKQMTVFFKTFINLIKLNQMKLIHMKLI